MCVLLLKTVDNNRNYIFHSACYFEKCSKFRAEWGPTWALYSAVLQPCLGSFNNKQFKFRVGSGLTLSVSNSD